MALSLRPAVPDDYSLYARLFPELHVEDDVPTRQRFETELMPTTFVAEDAGAGAGFAFYQVLSGTGYVRQVVVAPSARRGGVGRALMGAVAGALRAAGCAKWCLNVKPDNAAAVGLYETLGMRRAYGSAALRFGWELAEALPRATSISGEILVPEGDHDAEAAFALPSGQLAHARSLGRVLAIARGSAGGGGPVASVQGVAVFDPTFPGAFPFRAKSPEAARALLDVLRPRRLPELGHMQVVLEDAPELVRALVAHGASLRMEFQHMAGGVPPG